MNKKLFLKSKTIFLSLSILVTSFFLIGAITIPEQKIIKSNISQQSCQAGTFERNFGLDGVNINLCLSFDPEIISVSSELDMVQSVYAVSQSSNQELFMYSVPFGLQPASDFLPTAEAGISTRYQDLSFDAYKGLILAEIPVSPLNIFNQKAAGRAAAVINTNASFSKPYLVISQWVVEAGDRVWLIRQNSYQDNYSEMSIQGTSQALEVIGSGLETASLSLQIASQLAANIQPDITMSAADLPVPSWWNGDCDVNNFAGSTPLGSSYRGVKTCGPVNTMHLVNFGSGVSQYEWQCVEFVKRYLKLAYGIAPYLANGNTVVSNYSGTRLVKILNGTVNKAPMAGDVISYSGPSTYGHTALVTASSVNSSGNGTITIAEQNYSKTGTRVHTVTNWSVISSDGVYGWLHDNQQVNNPPAGFTKCADESGLCAFSGYADVVYGAVNSFSAAKTFINSTTCSTAIFGDPIPGTAKACYFSPNTSAALANWSAKYYSGTGHWSDLNNVTSLMCEDSFITNGLDKNYGLLSPCPGGNTDNWIADFSATFNFSQGNYVFQAQNDDGLQVWVGGQRIVNRNLGSDLAAACPVLSLNGITTIRVLLKEDTGSSSVRLNWSTNTGLCSAPAAFGKIGLKNVSVKQAVNPLLNWNQSTGADSYVYCLDSSNNNSCDSNWINVGSASSIQLSSLAYNSTYYWQVRAKNVNGETASDGGTWWSFSTMTDPDACYLLTTSYTGSGSKPLASPQNSTGCVVNQYKEGEKISFSAAPAADYHVINWTGTDQDVNATDFNSLSMPPYSANLSVNYVAGPPEIPVTISPDGTFNDDLHPEYTWSANSGAAVYYISLYNEDLGTLEFTGVQVSSSNCSGNPVVCSYHPQDKLLGNFSYAFQVSAGNSSGQSPYSPWRSFFVGSRTVNFRSIAAQDGFVKEKSEFSNLGGVVNYTSSSFNIGDNGSKCQMRAILSFNTSSLPDNAVVTSAIVEITKKSITGMDPFETHGLLLIDIRKPYFGTKSALKAEDFSSIASLSNSGYFITAPITGKFVSTLKPGALTYINKSGSTQFRVYFQLDDDNDYISDYLTFYSSEDKTLDFRPNLVITYYIP